MKQVLALFFAFIFVFSLFSVDAVAESVSAVALKAGDSNDQVKQLQERLKTLGLTDSKADGIYGKQTTTAVKEAQRLLALAGYEVTETGDADEQTLSLIYDEKAEAVLRTLCVGSKGVRVRELQHRLITLKMLDDRVDGDYGQNTANAVKRFQEIMVSLGVQNMPVDGVVSPAMLELINSDLSGYGFVAPIYFDESDPLSLTMDYLYSKGIILMDAQSGEILFRENENVRLFPASTTKIISLLVALESSDIDEMVTIPESAADIPEDSSLVPVYAGEEMPMKDLLYGLMIRSGNDAANAVAELCAGSVDAFVERMNQKAAELGMVNTRFTNPHGYHDPMHYTTAQDLAIATRSGLTDQTFCDISMCLNHTLPQTSLRGPLQIVNEYEIFNPSSPFYINGAAGVKSGYTKAAGFCYVGAAQRGDRTLIAVILNAPNRNCGWQDLKKLFEYGFAK